MRFIEEAHLKDPENKAWAYGYDHDGFYTGVLRRQPHPLPERRDAGEMLMPGNCVTIRPVLKEGFRPRWNGKAWDLVSIESLGPKKPLMKSLETHSQEAFDRVVQNVQDVAYSYVLRALEDRQNHFVGQQIIFRDQMFQEFGAVMRARFLGETEAMARELEAARAELGNVLKLAETIRDQVFEARTHVILAVAESRSVTVETRSLWDRVTSFWKSKEPVQEELPAPKDP